MRGEIDRDHVEHQLRLGGIKSVAAAREISQRRAGVDALVPSGKRIAQRAFYHRRAHHRDVERRRDSRAPTVRQDSWCSCTCWAIPNSARACDRRPSAAPRPIACADARRQTRADCRHRLRRRETPRDAFDRATRPAPVRSLQARREFRAQAETTCAHWGTSSPGYRLHSDARRRFPRRSRSTHASSRRRLCRKTRSRWRRRWCLLQSPFPATPRSSPAPRCARPRRGCPA